MKTKQLILAGLFAALTGIGAYLAIPIEPVPFTMQLFFTLIAGVVLGPKYGAISQVVYVLLGLIAPVYAVGASGPGVLFGPKGGYYFGFIAAAYLAGLTSRGNLKGKLGMSKVIAGMILGVVAIYVGGMISLHLVLGFDIRQAFIGGVLLFIPFDIVKAILAAPLAIRLKRHI